MREQGGWGGSDMTLDRLSRHRNHLKPSSSTQRRKRNALNRSQFHGRGGAEFTVGFFCFFVWVVKICWCYVVVDWVVL